ncbi:MAG TPA: phosphotransferase [Pseudomonadales bacterium]
MDELADWCRDVLRANAGVSGDGELTPLSGDASFRRYFRYRVAGQSRVAVHAPPEKEKNREFVQVQALLAAAGVPVPAVLGYDEARGFLLLSDLGDRLLLPDLSAAHADRRYRQAIQQMVAMQVGVPSDAALPAYDATRLHEEMALFPEWFLGRLLGYELSTAERAMLNGLFEQLVAEALKQPQVFVHRDYHARNIMILRDDSLATIDFQDAVIGPALYDPVSLFKDCYVRWPRERVLGWLHCYLDQSMAAGVLPADARDWVYAFDAMGLQRHIKVLGIFARLWLRDGKAAYLGDLTRVLGYVLEALALHECFAQAHHWFGHVILPQAATQAWFNEADLTQVRT